MDKKALSLPILTSLEIGNMVGTGIYILPATLAAYGTISLFAWVYTSIGALLIAVIFTKLSKRYPQTGGPYVYCREAFGKFTGFLIACLYWFTTLASTAGVIVASVAYLGYLIPSLDANNTSGYDIQTVLIVELGLLWLFTFINIVGVHAAGVAQFILTVLKIAPLLVIGVLGLGHLHLEHLAEANISQSSNFSAIGAAATLTFWAFIGIEAATVPAENTSGYKDIFKATIYGTLVTSFIYIFCSFVLMGMIAPHDLANSQFPFAQAGKILFGTYGAAIVVVCAFISGIGTLNACLLLQAQVVFAAARDKFLPRSFSKLTKHDVPLYGQLLGSIIVSIALILTVKPSMLKQFDLIALVASLFCLLTYFVTMLAEVKFLLRHKKHIGKALLNPSGIIALLAIAYIGWMISCFSPHVMYITGISIIACILLYFIAVTKWSAIKI